MTCPWIQLYNTRACFQVYYYIHCMIASLYEKNDDLYQSFTVLCVCYVTNFLLFLWNPDYLSFQTEIKFHFCSFPVFIKKYLTLYKSSRFLLKFFIRLEIDKFINICRCVFEIVLDQYRYRLFKKSHFQDVDTLSIWFFLNSTRGVRFL